MCNHCADVTKVSAFKFSSYSSRLCPSRAPPDVPVFPADSRKIRHFTLLGVRVVAQGSKTGTDALFCVSSIQYTSKSASTLKALEKAFIKKGVLLPSRLLRNLFLYRVVQWPAGSLCRGGMRIELWYFLVAR